jgi:hypothetical protein
MKLRHAAVLGLMYWILFLDTSPGRHGFNEWAGNFSTRLKCEQALSREQSRWYDMSPSQTDPDHPDIHAHGKEANWVRGLSGYCRSSNQVFSAPVSGN